MEHYDPYRIKQGLLAMALDRFEVTCMEAGIHFPPGLVRSLAPSLLWVGIETAAFYYANYPDQLRIVGLPYCLVCDREVEDWTVVKGGEPTLVSSNGEDGIDPGFVLVAGPCLHRQPWPNDRRYGEG